MGIIEKIALTIYSFIILAIAITISLLVFGWISPELLGETIMEIVKGEQSSIILLGVNILFILIYPYRYN